MALVIRGGFGHDLEELRTDLDAVEVGLGRLVGEIARKRLGPLIAEVQGLLPFDPAHRGWRGEHKRPDPGHIRDSVTGSSDARSLTIVTTHPGGPVHWWGGTIQPRHSLIEIHHLAGAGDEFTSKQADEVSRDVERDLDSLIRRHNL